jgi:response regulator RpfG family c-di-GMP phosphodiesterase
MTSVLIVDDEPAVRDIMSRWVVSLGLEARTAASAEEALASIRQHRCDLAVIDVMMPGQNGLWLASELHRDYPQTAVIIATAHADQIGDEPATPIADFLEKPFDRERFIAALARGRSWRQDALEDVRWHAALSAEFRERAAVLAADLDLRVRAGDMGSDALWGMLVARAPDIAAHGERVAHRASAVAVELTLDADLLDLVALAGRFHDVGKAALPESLLAKPSTLTPGEMAVMRRQVDVGARLLESTPALTHVAPIVAASHEWFGGGGYPNGTAGSKLPLASRILAVCDAYDAMTEVGVYRERVDSADAVAELLRCCPAQFDPDVLVGLLGSLGQR